MVTRGRWRQPRYRASRQPASGKPRGKAEASRRAGCHLDHETKAWDSFCVFQMREVDIVCQHLLSMSARHAFATLKAPLILYGISHFITFEHTFHFDLIGTVICCYFSIVVNRSEGITAILHYHYLKRYESQPDFHSFIHHLTACLDKKGCPVHLTLGFAHNFLDCQFQWENRFFNR